MQRAVHGYISTIRRFGPKESNIAANLQVTYTLTKRGVAMFKRFSLVLLSFLLIGLGVLPFPMFASGSPVEEVISLSNDVTIGQEASDVIPEDAELLFSVYQYGVSLEEDIGTPYACADKALANVRAYRVHRNSRQYIDLFIGLSRPLGSCLVIKGVTDGELRVDDLTTGAAFGEAINYYQPQAGSTLNYYYDGNTPINPGHSYDVSWHFKSYLLNGIDSYYSGSKTFFA